MLFVLGLALNRGCSASSSGWTRKTKIKNSLLISFGLTLVHPERGPGALDRRRALGVEQPGTRRHGHHAGVAFPYTRLAGLVLALLTIVALHQLLQRTYFGKAVRATAEDWEAASLAGIDVRRTYLVTFALGAALAGIAGTLVSIRYSIAPAIGLAWTLKALVVVVLAGLGQHLRRVRGRAAARGRRADLRVFVVGALIPRGRRAGAVPAGAAAAAAGAVREGALAHGDAAGGRRPGGRRGRPE